MRKKEYNLTPTTFKGYDKIVPVAILEIVGAHGNDFQGRSSTVTSITRDH